MMSDGDDPDRDGNEDAGENGRGAPVSDDDRREPGEGVADDDGAVTGDRDDPDPDPEPAAGAGAGAETGTASGLGDRVERIERREHRLEEREQRLEQRERELDGRESELQEREQRIEEHERELEERAVRIDERESAVEERIEEFEAARDREEERLDRAIESAGTVTNRTPAAGGILMMIVGIVTAVAGVGLLAAVATGVGPLTINFDFGAMAAVGLLGSGLLGELAGSGATVVLDSASVVIGLGAAALVLALLLIAGGWQAFQRKHWFFSLVTGILALLLVFPLGLLAIFLITVGERQFGAE